jgi:hypothetical protein
MPPDGLHALRDDWRRRASGLEPAREQAARLGRVAVFCFVQLVVGYCKLWKTKLMLQGLLCTTLGKNDRYRAAPALYCTGKARLRSRQSATGCEVALVLATRRGAVSAARRPLQIRKCAAVSTIPVTSANMHENRTTSMASCAMVHPHAHTPPSHATELTALLKHGGKVTAGYQN